MAEPCIPFNSDKPYNHIHLSIFYNLEIFNLDPYYLIKPLFFLFFFKLIVFLIAYYLIIINFKH